MDETFDTNKPWRAVAELHQIKLGFSRADAVKLVIIEWLLKGKIEPLLDAIATGELTDPVLSVIAHMLTRDESLPYYLTLCRQPGKGAPKKAGSLYRDMLMAVKYEELLRKQVSSERAFKEVADAFHIDVSTVRRAVSWYRQLARSLQAV